MNFWQYVILIIALMFFQQPVVEEEIIVETSIEEEIIVTLYNTYPQDEIDLLFNVVEAEIGIGNYEQKCHVVSVIFNRMKLYNATSLRQILIPGQFSVINEDGSYVQYSISDTTIQACEYIFNNGNYIDTVNGALFFESYRSDKNSHYQFILEDGLHKFYKTWE